jgi:hypothetical protein
MCCVALAVPFHLFTVQTKEVGDQRTLDGDLGDSIGDFVTGFGIGNVDVPIFMGGGWSSDSGPPSRVPSWIHFLIIVVSVFHILQYSALLGLSLIPTTAMVIYDNMFQVYL